MLKNGFKIIWYIESLTEDNWMYGNLGMRKTGYAGY